MLNLNLRGEVEASLILETARRFEVTGENGYAFAKDIVVRGLEASPELTRVLSIHVKCVSKYPSGYTSSPSRMDARVKFIRR
jgi:hypothetical protein